MKQNLNNHVSVIANDKQGEGRGKRAERERETVGCTC